MATRARARCARPATDHSASGRDRCRCARHGCACYACAGQQARCRRRRVAERSCRQSWRHAAQHRPPQPCVGAGAGTGPTISSPSAKLSIGMKLTVPASKTAPRQRRPLRPRPLPPLNRSAVRSAARDQVAAVDTQQKARLAQAAPNAEEPAVAAPVKAAEATGALPTFRWPVRGKVITATAPRPTASPMTASTSRCPKARRSRRPKTASSPIPAMNSRVTAIWSWSGIANGYVTAYAHASELLVKRGDTIKRGQVIAKSGQSGEVQSPQLHFEIRKGRRRLTRFNSSTGRKSLTHTRSSPPGLTGRPVFQSACDGAATLRRTGSCAFAEDDGLAAERQRVTSPPS